MSADPKRPIVSFSVGGFSVALWQNTFDNGDGTTRHAKSVSLRRSFFNKKEDKLDDQTITVSPQEIGCLIQLLSRMEQAVVEERSTHEPF